MVFNALARTRDGVVCPVEWCECKHKFDGTTEMLDSLQKAEKPKVPSIPVLLELAHLLTLADAMFTCRDMHERNQVNVLG